MGSLMGKLTPLFERIVQFRVFLLCASFVLAADAASTAILGQGVASIDAGRDGLKAGEHPIHLGVVLLFALAYMFFMSGMARLLRHVVEWVLFWPKVRIWLFFNRERDSDWRAVSGLYIRLGRLKDKATEKRDAVYLKIAEDAERKAKETADRDAAVSRLSFATAVLAAVDWGLGPQSVFGGLHQALAESGNTLLSTNSHAVVLLAVASIASPWAVFYWFRDRLDEDAKWVHCPAAAREFDESGRNGG